MSALTKSLHPDEKYKAGKLGASLWKIGAAIAVVFFALSLLFGWREGDHFKRFFYSYVVAWSFIWAARKDGEEERAFQKRFGIRRRTRLGR